MRSDAMVRPHPASFGSVGSGAERAVPTEVVMPGAAQMRSRFRVRVTAVADGQVLATGVLLAWLLIAVEILFFLYFGSTWLGGTLGSEQLFREFWHAFGDHGRGPTILFLWLHPLLAVHLWLSARTEALRGRRWASWLTLVPLVMLGVLQWCLYRYGTLPPALLPEILRPG